MSYNPDPWLKTERCDLRLCNFCMRTGLCGVQVFKTNWENLKRNELPNWSPEGYLDGIEGQFVRKSDISLMDL